MTLHPYLALWDFQSSFGQPHSIFPELPGEDRRTLRKNLLAEEYQEYLDGETNNDLVEIADALIDMTYIIYGTGVEYGLPMDDLFNEVHRSNMTKLDPATGKPIRRADGKIMKPPTYSKPDLASIIEGRRQGRHPLPAPPIDDILGRVAHTLESRTLELEKVNRDLNEAIVERDGWNEAAATLNKRLSIENTGLYDRVAELESIVARLKADQDSVGYACENPYGKDVGTSEDCTDDCQSESADLAGPDEFVIEESIFETRRFAVYVGCGDMPPSKVKDHVEAVKTAILADRDAYGDEDALFYFIATTGKTKIVAL
jgi:hypothetical protein